MSDPTREEIIDEVVECVANALGIYGICPKIDPDSGHQVEPCEHCTCRPGFTSNIKLMISNEAATKRARAMEERIRDSLVDDYYYILIKGSTVAVKGGRFFEAQGGKTASWGSLWIKIFATSIEDARSKGHAIVALNGSLQKYP